MTKKLLLEIRSLKYYHVVIGYLRQLLHRTQKKNDDETGKLTIINLAQYSEEQNRGFTYITLPTSPGYNPSNKKKDIF